MTDREWRQQENKKSRQQQQQDPAPWKMSQSFGSGVGRHRPRPGGSPQQQQSNHNSTGYACQQNHSTCHPPTPVQLSAPSADGCHRQQTQQLLQNVVGQLQASDRFHPSRQLPLGGQHSQRDDNNPPVPGAGPGPGPTHDGRSLSYRRKNSSLHPAVGSLGPSASNSGDSQHGKTSRAGAKRGLVDTSYSLSPGSPNPPTASAVGHFGGPVTKIPRWTGRGRPVQSAVLHESPFEPAVSTSAASGAAALGPAAPYSSLSGVTTNRITNNVGQMVVVSFHHTLLCWYRT